MLLLEVMMSTYIPHNVHSLQEQKTFCVQNTSICYKFCLHRSDVATQFWSRRTNKYPNPKSMLLIFLANVNYVTFAICHRPSVGRLSVTLVHPTQPVEIFSNFFSKYDSPGTLVFWCQNRWWATPHSPWNLRSKWPIPFKQRSFDQYRLIVPQLW